ncbi:MAG: FapA family protein [Spirochaetales bacterium]
MRSFRESGIGSFLQEVEELVASIETETDKRLFAEVDTGPAPEDLRRTGSQALESLTEHSRDGACDLVVSDDAMEARADFYPPAGEGKPLTMEAFVTQLDRLKITSGRLIDVIETSVRDCALGRRVMEGILVAQGTRPVPALPERSELLPELLVRKQALDEKAVFLDFKTQSPFVLVHAKDLLARRIPAQAGLLGRTVLGTDLDFARPNVNQLIPGENVDVGEAGWSAACDGSFRFVSGKFWVDKVLELNSGVGYTTGHIDFAGDVHITGEIASGFHIHAGGSVMSTRVIDATEIVCGADVVTPFGIIGRQGSVVKAEGRIRAKFLENVYVLARGEIAIQTSALNSWIQTLDRVVMGEKGLIIGGKIQAQQGIDVFQVGSERGGKAELVCGMDFSVVDKVEWARDQSLTLIKKLKALESSKARHPDQAAEIAAACSKVRGQILKMNELARSLVTRIDRNEDAEIIVRGTAHAGTYLEICHVSHVVSRAVSHVKFVLDKHRGVVRAVPL